MLVIGDADTWHGVSDSWSTMDDSDKEYRRYLWILRADRVNVATRRNMIDEIPQSVIERMYRQGDAKIVSDASGTWLVATQENTDAYTGR